MSEHLILYVLYFMNLTHTIHKGLSKNIRFFAFFFLFLFSCDAVINYTLCVFRWLIFQFPKSPISCPYFGRHWCPAPDINRDSNVSSMKTDFRYKRSFLSIAGAKVQQFGVENKFFRYRFFRGVCKYLTDSALQWYFGNQLLHFDWFWRKWRLVTQNFRKAVIWSWSCSVKIVFGSARSSYNII